VAQNPVKEPKNDKSDIPVVEVFKGESPDKAGRQQPLGASARSSMKASHNDGIQDSMVIESHPACKFCCDLFQGNERDKF